MRISLALLALAGAAKVYGSAQDAQNRAIVYAIPSSATEDYTIQDEEEALGLESRKYDEVELVERQNGGGGGGNNNHTSGPGSSDSGPSTSHPITTSGGGSTSQPQSSSKPQSSSEPSSQKPSSTKQSPSTSNGPSSTQGPSSTKGQDSSTKDSPTRTSKSDSSPTPTKSDDNNDSSSESPSVVIRTVTNDGKKSTIGSTIASAATSGATKTGALSTGKNDDNGGGGLSDKDKKIVIGVVVGVGGALLVGGLAFVAWRIWFRKGGKIGGHITDKDNTSFDDGSNVFRQNIDQYHTSTNNRVNTAANF